MHRCIGRGLCTGTLGALCTGTLDVGVLGALGVLSVDTPGVGVLGVGVLGRSWASPACCTCVHCVCCAQAVFLLRDLILLSLTLDNSSCLIY